MNYNQENKLKLIRKLRRVVMRNISRQYPDIRKMISKELDLLEYKEIYKK